ncbi:ABC transporter substrate-binding protein [Marinicrinis sediminis]|uniref:ABC transporter substrate-binding protein n=1 Tax=Marinicrinis sediminis TaxID=1652465 RepID=A0ABW5RFS4_9BACL
MKRQSVAAGLMMILLAAIVLSACSSSNEDNGEANKLDVLNAEWNQIAEEAEGQTVHLYMWGGSDSINTYIDEWVAPRVKEQANVKLKRVPMNDTKDIINQLLAEKQASKKDGSIDIMWINGENFKTAKENDLLFGSFVSKLPNANQYVDLDAPDIANDFGLETEGMEAPWGKAQFVFIYDEAKVADPPTSMEALKEWVKANPGAFTYPAPPDFNGSAFVRHVMMETTGGHEPYMADLTEAELQAMLEPTWNYLNEIEPYLWREGKTYPESLAKLDQMFANGEVWMSMGYDPSRASNLIEKGTFPETTRTFVLDSGTLSNTHYLGIPFNASEPAGAMVVINELLSPAAQIAKFDPKHWGEDMAIDPAKLSEEDANRLAEIDRGPATLSAEELASHRLPEIRSDYVSIIEESWNEHVAKP